MIAGPAARLRDVARTRIADGAALLAAVTARRAADRPLPMFLNSLALIAAKVASLGLGFFAWLVAARLFEASDVGVAAAIVAATMLCVQVALVGVGASVIRLLPERGTDPRDLLDTAMSVVTVASLGAGLAFVALAATVLRELRVVALDPLFTVAFLGLVTLGTLGVLLDQVSTVMGRGDQALLRNVVTGIATLVLLAVVAVAGPGDVALGVVVAWVVGNAAAVALGWHQLRRSRFDYRYRPRFDLPLARRLVGVGVPNWLLTLAERAPGPILPIVVTEVLSPAANARWYAVWMLAWVVFIIPIQVGLSAFAEASRRPDAVPSIVRGATRSALVLGLPAAAVLALLGGIVLALLGPGYEQDGIAPLRVLVWTVVPMTFLQAYFSVCRATGSLGEAIATATLATVAGVAASAVAATVGGLLLMAIAWLATQSVAAVWGVTRLARFASVARRTTIRMEMDATAAR